MKNSCEGVHEIQAIQYFTDGCLAGSMLKHKLLRKDFSSLAELIKVANAFAVSDSEMREPIQLDVGGVVQTQGAAQAVETGNQGLSRRERRDINRNNNNNNPQNSGKRKDEKPDA